MMVKMSLKEDPEGFMSKHTVEIAIEGDKGMMEFLKDAIEKAVDAHNNISDHFSRWKLT